MNFYQRGIECMDTDADLAKKLFDKAIRVGDNVGSAASCLGYLISKEDPKTAIELYRKAIDAGEVKMAEGTTGRQQSRPSHRRRLSRRGRVVVYEGDRGGKQ